MGGIVIFDIDVTLANPDHRAHWVDGDQKNWDMFLKPELCALDTVQPFSKRAYDNLVALGWLPVFLTGRNEGLREVTLKWLQDNFDKSIDNDRLFMRPLNNLEVPTEYKSKQLGEILLAYDDGYYHTEFIAFDDDPYMMAVYLKHGIMPFSAPKCFEHMFNIDTGLPPEKHWRK